MTAKGCLSENIVDRIFAGRFGALYESIAKSNFFDLIRFNAVPTYVFNSILAFKSADGDVMRCADACPGPIESSCRAVCTT